MEAGAANDYAKGMSLMSAARRVNIAARGLDQHYADALRKVSDTMTAEGLKLLRRAVKPGRVGDQSAAGG